MRESRLLQLLSLVVLLHLASTAVADPTYVRRSPISSARGVSYAGVEPLPVTPAAVWDLPSNRPAATFTVTTVLDTGAGSLRRAITDANAAPGLDRIEFAIPGTGTHTIYPRSSLPTIVSPVVINGATQSGYTGVPRILIDGNSLTVGADGLTLSASAAGSTIRGVAVNFFTGNGIVIAGANNTVVEGCYVGYDPDQGGRGNAAAGVFVQDASGCRFGGSSALQKNVFSANVTFGIIIRGLANNDTIQGSYIGLDPSGSFAMANGFDGVRLNVYSANNSGASNCLVGGTTAGERNVISGNDSAGVGLFGQVVTNNVVKGNYIGTNPSGETAIPNLADGVRFWSTTTVSLGTARNNRIGGTTSAERNVISGNARCGVFISGSPSGGSDNVIIGNFIGLKASGLQALANGWHGVLATTLINGGTVLRTLVGGGTTDSGNVISGNTRNGVMLEGSGVQETAVFGNAIGTDLSRLSALWGNAGDGVVVDGGSRNRIAGNVIAGNTGNGVASRGTGVTRTRIERNAIGTNMGGAASMGNGGEGVLLGGSRDTVGGTTQLDGNLIAYNRRAGVAVQGNGNKNVIRFNGISDNDSLGIDLGPNGITPNDTLDADGGANGLQNFPIIDSMVVAGPSTNVYGSIMSAPSKTYLLDFYMSPTVDRKHFGEGKTYLGTFPVTAGSSGVFRFAVTIGQVVPADRFVTVTATDDSGSTSEFSQAFSWRDSDGDGIYDHWETAGWGMDVNSDGIIDQDLYAAGARTDHKDLFLEVDGMAGYDVLPGTRELVINSFATVPDTLLHNPDGAPGIALHIAPFDDQGVPATAFPAVWSNFDQFKNTYCGTPGDRASANRRYILEAKKLVFRYCVFGVTYGTTPDEIGSSGLARGIVARDLMVTFGGWTRLITQTEQAGTLMHELGHTLGLRHGGGDDLLFKPNYYSVMNYTWQVPMSWQVPGSWTLDYSRAVLPPLNENSLDERVGLNPPAGAFRVVSVPYTDPILTVGQAKLRTRWAADWNGDGSIQAAPVAVDLNRLNNSPASPGEQLIGFSDWKNLVFNFRPTVTLALLDPSSVQDVGQELTFSMYNQLQTLPPPRPSGVFRMDGVLDSSAALLTRNGSTSLYATFNEGQLYVATEASAQNGSDIVLTVTDGRRALRTAPRGKAGQVAGWSALVWNQPSGNNSGWTDAMDSSLTSITVDSAGTVLEGVIDVEYLFGSRPASVFLAVGRYQTGPGGSLVAQVPAGNGDGNIDPGELYELNTSGMVTNVQLADGWNMLSVPRTVGDYTKTVLFPAAVSDAYTYQGGYVTRSVLQNGPAYWLRFSGAQSAIFSGAPRMGDSIVVNAGWNMIGSVSAPVQVTSIREVPPGNVVSQYFGFNGAYAAASTIQPGFGYWVRTTQAGRLVLDTAGALLVKPDVHGGRENRSGRITFADAQGRTGELLIAPGELDTVLAAAPPLPPAGGFDVRFAGDSRMLAAGGPTAIGAVEVRGAVYPLRISGEGLDSLQVTLVTSRGSFPLGGGEPVVLAQADGELALRISGRKETTLPTEFALHQNYPNPFNPSTRVGYDLPRVSRVTVRVYDLLGRTVATLVEGTIEAGRHVVEWKGRNDAGVQVPSGVYFLRMDANGVSGEERYTAVRKMIMLK